MPARAAANLPVFLLIFTLGSALLFGTDPALGQETAAPPAAESTTQVDEATQETVGDAEAEKAPVKLVDKVDAWFGTYLVTPLERFLFYDFGTGDWTDENGVEHKGWIGPKVPFVVVWLFIGAVYLTFRMGFVSIRAFKHAVMVTKGDYDNKQDAGEVSHFQALSSALSATVGLGNIGGVAMAVGLGGPGAVFWMVVAGFFGMTSKFTECTLGQMYREVGPDGRVLGGPMRYLKIGLEAKGLSKLGAVLALLFAILCIGASFGGGCAYQVSQSQLVVERAVQSAFSLEDQTVSDWRWLYGIVLAVMVGIVIIGGIRRIATTAELIVPFMCLLYVATSLAIILMNFTEIIPAFGKIFHYAWNPQSVYGGIIGAAVMGIQRAAFSNEAGTGSAAIAHSAAKTDHPVREGIVALLEPFIDTLIICTITGLVIVITEVYDAPEYEHLVKAKQGAALTTAAWGTAVWWFPYVLAVCVFLFAYSTMISWSYYGERCSTFLFGPGASFPYRCLFVVCVFLGAVIKAQHLFDFSDMMILAMAVPNILGLYILSGVVKRSFDDYWLKYKAGEFVPNNKA